MRRVFVLATALLIAAPAIAQTREPLPWFAADLHVGSLGLPTAEGWVPIVPLDTLVPDRTLGISAAGNVYPFRLGIVTFGFGAAWSTGSRTAAGPPIVRTKVVHILPQLSINFGHKLGWSYLSAGVGRTRVESSAEAFDALPAQVVPAAWNQALNFGGGARWFMKPRLGAGFDVRFIKLGSRGATAVLPFARRTQMITFSAGISIQ
jgi:hypothetical protein